MKRLCTICARGGSKGVKNKNIRDLLGKPLIAHSVEQARASQLFDTIAVSSDSEAILAIAREYGADLAISRPPDLASDRAPKLAAIRHCVTTVEAQLQQHFATLVDLDATSPLRLPEDIQGVVALLETQQIGNVITGSPARRSPYFNLVEVGEDGIARLSKPPENSIVRRQDSPPCFDMNASIYAWQHDILWTCPTVFNRDTRLFVMPAARSFDIDSELDFAIVEMLLQK